MYNLQNKLIFIFLGLFTFQLMGQDKQIIIDWQQVPGAGNYLITIENSNQETVNEISLTEPPLSLPLLPGSYRYSIEVFNKFNEPLSSTGWQILEVKKSMTPIAEIPERSFWYNNGQPYESIINISGLEPDAHIYFQQMDKTIDLEYSKLDDHRYSIFTESSFDDEGEWNLHIENPSGKTAQIPNALSIIKYQVPQIDSLSTYSLYYSQHLSEIGITGRGFSKNSQIHLFRADQANKPVSTNFINENSIIFRLDPQLLEPGSYILEIQNKNKEISRAPRELDIIDDTEETQIEQNERTDELTKVLALWGGYRFANPLFYDKEVLTPSTLGASIQLDILLNNSFLQGKRKGDHFFSTLQFSFQKYDYILPTQISLLHLSLDTNLHYKFLKNRAFRPGLLLGIGLNYSQFINWKYDTKNSLDAYIQGGLSFSFDAGSRLRFQQQLFYRQDFYIEHQYQHIQATTSLGVWLK